MHYTYDVLVMPANTSDNHLEVPVKLSAGIVKHVTIIFPPGCVRLVHCAIWSRSEQVLPSNAKATYSEDNYAVEIDCYIPTYIYGNELTILAWNMGCQYQHLLRVMFDVQNVSEPDLAVSINTLNNVIDVLVSLIKGYYI